MPPSTLYLHRSRFIDYTPPSITALAFSHPSLQKQSSIPTSLRLAIGRSNGDIEIWNPQKGIWVHESTLKGGKDRSIEGLAWTQDTKSEGGQLRLFSIGYSSVVTEWDLESGRPKKHVDCNGGVIWSIAAQPRVISGISNNKGQPDSSRGEFGQELVVGLDDGSVAVLNTEGGPGFLEYRKTLMRSSSKKARVLSLAWQTRHTVVAGMADSTIRVWDIRSGRVVTTMSVGKDTKKSGGREALIWAVKVLANGDIVSGDSRGEILFWDGKTYSLRQRVKVHEADVLTLEVNRSGDMVVSSGVDRRTVFFGLQKGGKHQGKWVEIHGRRYHNHDVRAMSAWEGGNMSFIASGGVDMTPIIIPFANFNKEIHRILQAIPQKPITAGVPSSRLIASWYDREVKIWKIDELGDSGIPDQGQPAPTDPGRKLVSRLVLGNEENVSCAHITAISGSKGSHILAVATTAQIKIFHLRPPKQNSLYYSLRVSRIQLPRKFRIKKDITKHLDRIDEDNSDDSEDDENDNEINVADMGARLLQFSPDGKWLLVITPESEILLLEIEITATGENRTKISVSLNPNVTVLDRVHRTLPHEQTQKMLAQAPETPSKKSRRQLDLGHLNSYPLSISRAAFSSTSRIFAVSDLSGHIDSYVLSSSGWKRNTAGGILPKVGSSIVAMEFRPVQSKQSGEKNTLSNGSANQTSLPDFQEGEDRLIVLTAHAQDIFEFQVLKGKLTDWSRRNPPKKFPSNFKALGQPGCGLVWEIEEDESNDSEVKRVLKERIWVWGITWLYMFDLLQDLPEISSPITSSSMTTTSSAVKRKRSDIKGPPLKHALPSLSKGSQKQMTAQSADTEGDIAMQDDDAPASDDDNAYDDDARWGNFSGRWVDAKESDQLNGDRQSLNAKPTNNGSSSGIMPSGKKHGQADNDGQYNPPAYWSSLHYKPIMAFLPIGEWNRFSSSREEEDVHAESHSDGVNRRREGHMGNASAHTKEVVIVERPLWDIELPPRFYGKKERADALKSGVWGS